MKRVFKLYLPVEVICQVNDSYPQIEEVEGFLRDINSSKESITIDEVTIVFPNSKLDIRKYLSANQIGHMFHIVNYPFAEDKWASGFTDS